MDAEASVPDYELTKQHVFNGPFHLYNFLMKVKWLQRHLDALATAQTLRQHECLYVTLLTFTCAYFDLDSVVVVGAILALEA